MVKPINQDLGEFKEDFFKGLSLRETFFGGLALIVGGVCMLVLIFFYKMNANLAVTLCMPIVAFIGLCGFYEKNGMTLWQILKRAIQLKIQKPFTYETRMHIEAERGKMGVVERMLMKMNQKQGELKNETRNKL